MCKTCSDFNHECLGYSEPATNVRAQSDTASRTPAATPSLATPVDSNTPRGVPEIENRLPGSPKQNILSTGTDSIGKSPDVPKPLKPEESPPFRDASVWAAKENEQQAAGESPESSMCSRLTDYVRSESCSLFSSDRTSVSSNSRTHVPYFRYFGPTAIVPGFKQMVSLLLLRL